MRTAIAAADPDEPDRPMSAPRPDHLRAVTDSDPGPSDNEVQDRQSRELLATAAQLTPEGRQGLIDRLRGELAVLNSLDTSENEETPSATGLQPALLAVPELAVEVGVEDNSYLAALATLAQHGPVHITRAGTVIAVITSPSEDVND